MISRQNFDCSVYFILDPSLCAGRDPVDVARAAIRGGVTMLQYRDKGSLADTIIHNLRKLKDIASKADVPFLINDHVDIAKEVGADGVHLGQDDMNPEQAREILGPEAIIGVTAFTEDQIAAINPDIVDYIGMGPFYTTQTKKNKPILGEEGARRFRELAALSPVPVVGIGGITPDNAGAVIKAGAHGVAMMRSVSESSDPEEAASAFVNAIGDSRLREAC